ncbi:hypothetical protein PPIS_a6001 [Pseudoalteromonas piscicida]|uniref:Uncharacterized protein n=1 Tax=Pseudoalteromonas piscicida TaxID=43662 RepID=A0ABM6NCE4_PSEO7|nr:hypothetical protein PPIS_a6001 [Pseudoalteromonas piscicida]
MADCVIKADQSDNWGSDITYCFIKLSNYLLSNH